MKPPSSAALLWAGVCLGVYGWLLAGFWLRLTGLGHLGHLASRWFVCGSPCWRSLLDIFLSENRCLRSCLSLFPFSPGSFKSSRSAPLLIRGRLVLLEHK